MNRFERTTTVNATPAELFAWHARPGALRRLTPPWQQIRVLDPEVRLEEGTRVRLRIGRPPLAVTWTAEHTHVDPGRSFEDRQLAGPFRHWLHRHLFEPVGESESLLRDVIDYRLPGGWLGQTVAGGSVGRSLERTFTYRHRTTVADLALHRRYAEAPRLRVGVTGAGGLIGSALTALLQGGGHTVVPMVRGAEAAGSARETVRWSPAEGLLNPEAAEGLDAVVHLAGENISHRRWSERQKVRILDSRVLGTERLIDSLGGLGSPPGCFLCASAIGFYGDRGEQPVEESAAAGSGFLAEVCRRWEEQATGAESWGARVAMARFGIVLSPRGGALAKMLPAFRAAAGGRLGNGRQIMSWISLDDAAAALMHILLTPGLSGPVNLTSPDPVSNRQFTRTLGQVLRRPTLVPVPRTVARLLFGQLADELLLAGSRVVPRVLLDSHFHFRHSELSTALSFMLGRD